MTVPSARSRACQTGRKKLILSSTVVNDSCSARVDAKAMPMAASAISHSIPPCRVPMGFACWGPACNVTIAFPLPISLGWNPMSLATGTPFSLALVTSGASAVSWGLPLLGSVMEPAPVCRCVDLPLLLEMGLKMLLRPGKRFVTAVEPADHLRAFQRSGNQCCQSFGIRACFDLAAPFAFRDQGAKARKPLLHGFSRVSAQNSIAVIRIYRGIEKGTSAGHEALALFHKIPHH